MVYYYNHPVKVLTKNFFTRFWPFFYPNLSVLTPKNIILTHFSHSAHRFLLLFHIKTIFMVFYYDYLVKKVLRKVCFALFWHVFEQKMSNLTQKYKTIFEVFNYNYILKVLKNIIFTHFLAKNLQIWLFFLSFGPLSHNILIGISLGKVWVGAGRPPEGRLVLYEICIVDCFLSFSFVMMPHVTTY